MRVTNQVLSDKSLSGKPLPVNQGCSVLVENKILDADARKIYADKRKNQRYQR
jgi:hypothetical protein